MDELSEDELLILQETAFRRRIRRFLNRLVQLEKANVFAMPMSDQEAYVGIDAGPTLFPTRDSASNEKWETVAAWRRLASELGYSGPIAWQIRAGFTLKQHGPKAGYCYEDWKHIQDVPFQNDNPTEEGITFWIPRLLPGSIRLDAGEQLKHLTETQCHFEIPEYHLRNFGPAALLVALIQSHFRRTGERVPLSGKAARTNALYGDRAQVILYWKEHKLICNTETFGELSSEIGVFPWGWATLGCKV